MTDWAARHQHPLRAAPPATGKASRRTSPVGEKVPRQTYLDNPRDRTVAMTEVEPSDEEMRVRGDCAVVTATWTVDEAYRGNAFKGPVRITRTWVREAADWKALAFQVTSVAPH